MKRLLLLRHAKAVAATTKAADHGRSLNDRGRSDAPRIAVAMEHRGYIPDVVLCSTSRRTVETWEHVAPELGGTPEVTFSDAIYLATAKALASAARALGESARTALFIGHNPGLEECARMLARKPRSEDERRRYYAMTDKFPTAALAVLDLAVDSWSEIAAGTGELVDFLRPKALTDE